jgi:hypothetical protein
LGGALGQLRSEVLGGRLANYFARKKIGLDEWVTRPAHEVDFSIEGQPVLDRPEVDVVM